MWLFLATTACRAKFKPSSIELANKVASSSGLLKHAVNSPKKGFIVTTENGILYEYP